MINVKKKVVIVDDDVSALELLDYNFLKAGYTTECFSDSTLALDFLKVNRVDCVITDWMMPLHDGIELVYSLNNSINSETVKVMISCKGSENEVIEALKTGLDDYMIKPLRVKELIVRVDGCITKKEKIVGNNKMIGLDGLVLDVARFEVHINNQKVNLSKSEFLVLELFIRNRNRVLSRDYILEKLHGSDINSTSRSIDVIVHAIRFKLTKYNFNKIQTVYGMGYKMG